MRETEEITVGDAMTRGVIGVDVNDNVQRAAEVMKKNDIESVIVMEKGGGVGIVTERDIICKIVAESKDPKRTKVAEIMTSPLITIRPDAGIDEAAKSMRDNDIHRLIVMDRGKIIGVISEFDLVRIEPALHTLIREHSMWNITDVAEAGLGTVSGVCEVCENYSENLHIVDGRLICEDCIE